MKKLKDSAAAANPFRVRIGLPGRQLGSVVFQLTPLCCDDEARLAAFLAGLRHSIRYAFAFRGPSWHNRRCYVQLESHGATCAIRDLERQLSSIALTADFTYVRLHGPDVAFRCRYGDDALPCWADRLMHRTDHGVDV